MGSPAIEPANLSTEDWALLAHLLALHQKLLLAEIRHTDKRAFRDALHERLNQVEGLLARIPSPEPADQPA
jgi:hypothetical protein